MSLSVIEIIITRSFNASDNTTVILVANLIVSLNLTIVNTITMTKVVSQMVGKQPRSYPRRLSVVNAG